MAYLLLTWRSYTSLTLNLSLTQSPGAVWSRTAPYWVVWVFFSPVDLSFYSYFCRRGSDFSCFRQGIFFGLVSSLSLLVAPVPGVRTRILQLYHVSVVLSEVECTGCSVFSKSGWKDTHLLSFNDNESDIHKYSSIQIPLSFSKLINATSIPT